MKNIVAKFYIIGLVFAVGVPLQSIAADWTDADDSTITYTALKSIKGGGSAPAYINTGIVPNGTETVKFKFKPTDVRTSSNDAIFCSRDSSAAQQFAGFKIGSKIRIDRNSTQSTCNSPALSANSDYSVVANYSAGTISINGTFATLNNALGTGDYRPTADLYLYASHKGGESVSNKGWYWLYYFQMYSSGGVLQHNFMPAKRDIDNVIGVYDTVQRKFYAPTGGSFANSTARTVIVPSGCKKWTGLGGADNKMSTGANWEGGVAPQAGDDLDFTLAAPLAEINADMNVTFGKVWIDDGDLPGFTNTLTATAINDPERMQVYDTATEAFTFMLASQDFTWNGGAAANWSTTDSSWLCNSAASVWYDYNNAILNTADATVTLTEDVRANSLVFNQNATVTVDGTATLTVPTVSVAADVSATISAPTAGALEKIGAGTLTLGSSRTDQTTLSEGTLKMASGATLDLAKLTLGTNPAKPVSLDLGGATINADLTSRMSATVGGAAGGSVAIDNGAITNTATLRVGNGSLTLGSDAHVTMNASDERWVCVGGINSANEGLDTIDASLVLDGTSINKSGTENVFLAIGDFGSYPSKATMIVKNGGKSEIGDTVYVAQGCEGHLVIDGEGSSVTAYQLVFCNAARCAQGENGYVVVTNGGTLVVNRLRYGSGAGEGYFRFDGGTLLATAAVTLLPAHDNLHYEVGELGGTIDNDGKNITIAKGFSGTGTISLTGSGTTTFAAGVGAEGGVSVANGTTLALDVTEQSSLGSLTLAAGSKLALEGVTSPSLGVVTLEAGSTIDIATPATDVAAFAATTLNLPAEDTITLTSGGGAFGEGLYAICEMSEMSGVTVEDVKAKFVPLIPAEIPAEKFEWSIREADNTLMLAVGDINPNTWTGAIDSNLSEPRNWLGGNVPRSGAAIINCGAETTLTIGNTFAPTSITFGKGCGPVTINGRDLTGIVAVTNLSSASHTINAKVYFAGDIQVKQAAMAETSDLTKAHVTFAGGAYAAEGCSLESGDFAAKYSRCIFGKYYLSSTSDNRWAAQYQSGDKRVCVADGSSLYIPYASNLTELYVGTGAKVDVGDILLNAGGRLSYLNYGEMAVTNLTMTGKGDRHLTYNQGTGYSSVFKFNSVTNSMTGNWFYLGNAEKVNSNSVFYFGEGGVNFSGNAATYCFGSNQKYDGLVIIRPWYGDFTIAKRDDDGVCVRFNHKVEFNTNDESGVPRTIIWEAKTISNRGSSVAVTGNGTLLVNNTHFIEGGGSSYYPSVTVMAPATLAFGKGANLGKGAVTVEKDATMEVLSGINKFDGGLNLNDGATLSFNFTERAVTPQIALPEGETPAVNGAVKVKIPADSKWPTGGKKILTTCGGFNAEGVTVSLITEGVPKWAKNVDVNADGNIVLDVKPMGTKVIVR